MPRITKKQFETAYNNHQPSAFIKFAYKHFSTKNEKHKISLNNIIVYVLLISFFVGFFGSAFHASRMVVGIGTLVYSILLFILVGFIFCAMKLNDRRLDKIRKELGLTKDEYTDLAAKFDK